MLPFFIYCCNVLISFLFFSSCLFSLKYIGDYSRIKCNGGFSKGDHLLPFRTEKLSPLAPMVLGVPGRVGRRQFLRKPYPNQIWLSPFCLQYFLVERLSSKLSLPGSVSPISRIHFLHREKAQGLSFKT